MAFKDELLRCAACGKTFVYTVREQRARLERGQSADAPVFCFECRSADVRLAEPGLEDGDDAADGMDRVQPIGDQRLGDQRPGRPERERRSDPFPPASQDTRPRPEGLGRDARSPSNRRDQPQRTGGQPGGPRPERTAPPAGAGAQPTARRGGRRPDGGGGDGRRRDGPPGEGRRSDGPRGAGRMGGGRRGPKPKVRQRQTELRLRFVGTVKWFDEDRGFGFIAQEDGEELFVHTTAVILDEHRHLREGQPVEYEIERTPRGMQAVDVIPLAL